KNLAISLDVVKSNFDKYGLLDHQVKFLDGWFQETMPSISPEQQFAIVRIDADYYESTMIVLNTLYDKISPGGYVIVDDYGVMTCCRQAVHEFHKSRNIRGFRWIDHTGIFWQKLENP